MSGDPSLRLRLSEYFSGLNAKILSQCLIAMSAGKRLFRFFKTTFIGIGPL